MKVERLPFDDPAVRYHSYHAAQHIVRYAAARHAVSGKRVLDAACGEGYGARLMLDWGAKEVVGVDIFPAAIATAKHLFGNTDASFLVGDVEALDRVLEGAAPFDVIVSFETVEHLARPEKFLGALPSLLNADGAIFISCPNDLACGDESENPFHLRTYTFSEFQEVTERHLGRASMWMLGAPLLGEINFLPGDPFVQNPREDQMAMTDMAVLEHTIVIPSQYNLTTDEATCSHYIGIWGAHASPNAAISSQSVESFQRPWKTITHLESQARELERTKTEYYEPELARLHAALSDHEKLKAEWYEPQLESRQAEIERLSEANRSTEARLEATQVKLAELEKRAAEHYEPELARLHAALSDHEKLKAEWYEPQLEEHQAEIGRLNEANRGLEARLAELEKRVAEHYEPEIARLRSHVEHAKFEKETQALRRRVLAYAEQSKRAADDTAALQEKLAEAERLAEIIRNYEQTKQEWWDPQLELRAARIAELEAALEQLAAAKAS